MSDKISTFFTMWMTFLYLQESSELTTDTKTHSNDQIRIDFWMEFINLQPNLKKSKKVVIIHFQVLNQTCPLAQIEFKKFEFLPKTPSPETLSKDTSL